MTELAEGLWLWLESNALWFWLVMMVVFGILEAETVALVSVWFVAGAAAALVAALAGCSFLVQWAVFLVGTAVALAMTRPLVRRSGRNRATPTNADRVPGTMAVVTETIDDTAATGAVYADGKTWTARSVDGTVIPAGERVLVNRIEGVKLLVELPVHVKTAAVQMQQP